MKIHLLFLTLCFAVAADASAQLYKSVSSSGAVTYSNQPAAPRSASVTVIPVSAVQTSGKPVAGAVLNTGSVSASAGMLARMDVELSGASAAALVGAAGMQGAAGQKVGLRVPSR